MFEIHATGPETLTAAMAPPSGAPAELIELRCWAVSPDGEDAELVAYRPDDAPALSPPETDDTLTLDRLLAAEATRRAVLSRDGHGDARAHGRYAYVILSARPADGEEILPGLALRSVPVDLPERAAVLAVLDVGGCIVEVHVVPDE